MPSSGHSASREATIKAAFVYNFIKFVEWPDTAFKNSKIPITLCVWGNSALDGGLDSLSKKTAKNREIQILHTQKMRDLSRCHVLFVNKVDRQSLKNIVRQAARTNILTISDREDFAQSGGIIGLFRAGERMRFTINLEAAKGSGLQISSQLLRLGKIISNQKPQP